MAFCPNCGQRVSDGAKFCESCGQPIGLRDNEASRRRQEYAGKLIKCPSCGEVLNSFVSVCPSCGYELRGASASDAVERFSAKLESAHNSKVKAEIINSFPIPNTKEDILEFMILAISNTNGDPDDEIFLAWQSKMEQAYQKAKLVFTDENERADIQRKYDQFMLNVSKKRTAHNIKKVGHSLSDLMPVMPQIIIDTAWLISLFVILPLCRSNLDNVGTNAFQLLFMVDLIAGAVFVPLTFRCASALPKLITVIGLALSIVFLIPLCTKNLDNVGTNAFQLLLILDLICTVVIMVRGAKKSRQYSGEPIKVHGISLLVALTCAVIFLAVYGIGTLRVPSAEKQRQSLSSPTIAEDTATDDSKGIYTYEVRNYVGKNAASVGKKDGDYLIDEYGSGELRIVFVTADGNILALNDEETKKNYTVTQQNIQANSPITVVHLRDSRGDPYSNLVDYQSYDEILLYVSPIGETSYEPSYTTISPTLDRHVYHIRDYVGRNAASFGKYYGDDRIDEYGSAELKIAFTSEDGSYIDTSNENLLKCYMVTKQDIEPNKELRLEYETDSRGNEYDNLIRSQSYQEITLTVRRLDDTLVNAMPDLTAAAGKNDSSSYTELTIKYRVLSNGKAEISGYSGDGNHATINKKIDGYEIIRIGNDAFKGCTTLESVLFWADIEEIGNSAFKDCTALTEISVPNETTFIGDHAFEGCTGLTSAILWGDPDIGDYAFAGCTSLTSMSIGNDTKSIGAHAFDGCTELESVIIWNDDTVVGKDAFANCPKLDRPIQDD